MKIIKKLLLFISLLFFAALLVGVGYYLAVTKSVELDPRKLVFNEQTLLLYDGNGKPSSPSHAGSFRQSTSIREIPQKVQRAFVDTEDRRFYRHSGYDLKGIARASLHNLQSKHFKEGASTISQQLIKNTHLSQEKTVKRKLREWKLTRELERRYSKAEILERYLNTIYFGHGCFGITSAAEFYFGKTPASLSVGEGAILAGLVKSPNHYSPFKNPEGCQRRKEIVLAAMEENGSLTHLERTEAQREPLPLSSATKKDTGYAGFVFDELTALAEEYAFKIGGKIEIYTYLDAQAQQALEEIAEGYTDSDKSLFLLDSATGGFKGCVSTLGNRPRLPGSLIKPLLVYAPALEEDILSPATPILDERVDYAGYSPENYDGKYHGYVSVREALEKSLNIPAVKILESLTLNKATRYMQRLHLPVAKEDESLALALGGMKEGYTLKELVSAYSTFVNGGVSYKGGFISAVKINGIPVYTRSVRLKRVFSEGTAYLINDMLKGAAKQGTAKKLRALPFEIAAKTGTVGTKKGNTDAYALSYTTRDVAAVWLGNADNRELSHTGGGTPCSLLYQINQALYSLYRERGEEISPFPYSNEVQKVELDKASYYDTHTIALADEFSPPQARFCELFKKSAIPLNKSTSYSFPRIAAPRLSVKGNRVTIALAEGSPTYYAYKIDRYDYATHTTVYEGEYLPVITDEGLRPDKHYLYTVTPYFEGRAGESVTLPLVTTKTEEKALPKEWWEY